jgi:hypothetical protein
VPSLWCHYALYVSSRCSVGRRCSPKWCGSSGRSDPQRIVTSTQVKSTDLSHHKETDHICRDLSRVYAGDPGLEYRDVGNNAFNIIVLSPASQRNVPQSIVQAPPRVDLVLPRDPLHQSRFDSALSIVHRLCYKGSQPVAFRLPFCTSVHRSSRLTPRIAVCCRR